MAFRSVVSSKMPMVIILGATGTGKTKLSLELAQKFQTEIISADSMQIYKGLNIVTAKATAAERALVPHHLLDILEPHQYFTVVDFRNRALKIIDELTQQGKIPIIVGGTNYYIESIVYNILVEGMKDSDSLLWDVSRRKRDLDPYNAEALGPDSDKKAAKRRIEDDCSAAGNKKITKTEEFDLPKELTPNLKHVVDKDSENVSIDKHEDVGVLTKSETESNDEVKDTEKEDKMSKEHLQADVDNEVNFSNEEIHNKLKLIDPQMADRLHPNNRRKVLRSIEVWLKSGRRHSELLDAQKDKEGKLRRPGATVILWLKCDQQVLDERLDGRVDCMLREGLLDELIALHVEHNKLRMLDGQSPDYTKGIFQTLGFKEFHEYLMMDVEKKTTPEGVKLLNDSIENMKMATKRYARRQNKMTRSRFLEHSSREVAPIFELDTTNLEKWNEEVTNKAMLIIKSYLRGTPCKYEPLKPPSKDGKSANIQSTNYCETCQRIIIGDLSYDTHLKSNKHMKVLKIKTKLAAIAAKAASGNHEDPVAKS